MNSDKWIKRETSWAIEYVAKRENEGVVQEARAQLASCGQDAEIMLAPGALEDLANWYGAAGCLAVLKGDDAAFALVDRACLYNFWAIVLCCRAYDLDERPDKQPRGLLLDQVTNCWLHAEAIGDKRIRSVLDGVFGQVANGYGGVAGRDMNALCTLVAHYVTGRPAKELERAGWAPIGVYECAASERSGNVDYDALAINHQKEVDHAGFPAFHAFPYRLAALELAAIARRTGSPVRGTHPLVTSPLALCRDVREIPIPDEVQPLVRRAAREMNVSM